MPEESGPSQEKVYSVSEITREIRMRLEDGFQMVWVEGEISNFTRHSSGHFYFSLKDAQAQISCVMWRGRNQNLLFHPEDGMKVLVQGSITVFERQGRYQIDIAQIRPAGVGELQLAFEALKKKLQAEGLFDTEHKQALPAFPERVGIVTSPTGAAIRDIVSIIGRRFPSVQLILRPVKVQGESAAEEIALAIEEFNAYGNVDVLIVGRGGGSLEDLWAFNEEVVARAIYTSRIPVISAVGHEIDFTISDFTADVRAPTPSAAAELVVPDRADWMHRLRILFARLTDALDRRVSLSREKIEGMKKNYGFRWPQDRIREYRLRTDDFSRRMDTALQSRIGLLRSGIQSFGSRIESLNPAAVLKRGYSIVTKQDGTIVRRSSQVGLDEDVRLRFGEGSAGGRITQID